VATVPVYSDAVEYQNGGHKLDESRTAPCAVPKKGGSDYGAHRNRERHHVLGEGVE
jgi:hypothetical protein